MPKFATCLNCMDGRVQLPAINWLMKEYSAEYVDMITEAGMDGYLVKNEKLPEGFIYKLNISAEKHGSKHIFIVGHYDCGGHPVDEKTHREHVHISVDKIKSIMPDSKVIGLWINEKWAVEKIVEK
ncbi:MAG: hypothetical protein J7K40_14590 [candidate division Zixibacteria bacterium]|nr:hypothetical protein [candidate division Zixibacteria bacterium]